ncbi:ComEC/Rec2 family competence protein [Flavihumibacter solisilvae]|nr:ComEC/Rec2 family competence protein [Flavihumibacter solisilvae]
MPRSTSTQYPWKNAPFIRLLPPFICGILWGDIHGPGFQLIIGLVIACSMLALLLFNNFNWFVYAARWLAGIPVNLLLFCSGQQVFMSRQLRDDNQWIGHKLDHAVAIAGTPVSLPEPGAKFSRFGFECAAVIDSAGNELRVIGTININVNEQSLRTFMPGDTWLISTSSIKALIPTDNPGSFDFARYCFRNQVFHEAYLDPEHCHLIRKAHWWNLKKILAAGRMSAMNAVRNTMPEETRALAMALLIGYRQEMDKELLKTYTDTGVIHVIAVSGMHLGLVFLLLQTILKFSERKFRFTRWTNSVLILVIIWWFSGVAGGTASVVRAAAMFTLVLAARLTRKSCTGIHSLSLFAFLLLCYRPSWLWDAGFQLSFLALLGIFLFQPAIEKIFNIRNLILKHTWQLCSATLAAQLTTFPISIYLFHQSPLYFLPANLWAVPLSNLALVSALIQWLVTSTGISITWAGSMSNLLLKTMNAGIRHISDLPMSVVTDLNWQLTETLLIYLVIFCMACRRYLQVGKLFIATLFLFCILAGFQLNTRMKQFHQQRIIVYHLRGKSVTDLVNGRMAIRLANLTGHPAPTAAARYYGIQTVRHSASSLFRTSRILVAIPRNNREILPLLSLNPGFLVITGRIFDLTKWKHAIPDNTTCILDGSIREAKAAEWERALRQSGIPVHNTWIAGAFQKDLNKLPGLPTFFEGDTVALRLR